LKNQPARFVKYWRLHVGNAALLPVEMKRHVREAGGIDMNWTPWE